MEEVKLFIIKGGRIMKSKVKKIVALLLTGVVVVAMLGACGSGSDGNSASSDKYIIPVLCPVTGAVAFVGKPASWAAEYAAKVINEQGGINGKEVEVVVYDTKFDTAEAVSAMSEVVDDSLVIVGPMDAPGAEAAGQVGFDASVTSIAAYSYNSIREQYSPYAISEMTDSEEGDWLSAQKWISANPDIKTVALFTCPTDSSQMATTELLKEKLPTLGVTVEKVVEIETGTLDCGPAAVQAINAGVDGYVSVLRADEDAKLVSELRTRGVDEGRRITSSFAAYSDNFIEVAGASALDGTYIWNKMDPTYDSEEWNALVKAYKADFDGASPSVTPVPDFYNAIMAIKQCYEELGITGDVSKLADEKAAIAKWFYNSPVIAGVQGDYQWIKGKKVAPVYFFQFEGATAVKKE